MEKDMEVQAHDYYGDNCLVDKAGKKTGSDRRPQGYVKIFEIDEAGNKKIVGKSNLVVYLGREILAQRLVNQNNSYLSDSTNGKDQFVSWLGLGDGGVNVSDPYTPIAPVISDDGLSSEVMINSTDSSCADLRVIPTAGYYKKYFDSIIFETDSLNENRYLILKITTTLSVDDADGEQLSEAGLFTSASSAGGYGGQFNLFARVTFPTIIKDSSRRLIFIWYLYV